jgi:hypothetical protein
MDKKPPRARLGTIDFNFPEEEVRGYISPSLSFLRFLLPGLSIVGLLALLGAVAIYVQKHTELDSYRIQLRQDTLLTEQSRIARDRVNAQLEFVDLIGRWMEISLPTQRFLTEMTEDIPPQTRILNLELDLASGYPQMELKLQVEGFDGKDSYDEILRVSNYLTSHGFVNNGESMPSISTNAHELTGSYLLPNINEKETF